MAQETLDLAGLTYFTNKLLSAIYPIGAIYIGVTATCPIADLGVGTWALVAQDLSLQGAGTNAAGSTVAAGLPNITGTLGDVSISNNVTRQPNLTGAFSATVTSTAYGGSSNYNAYRVDNLSFDASASNAIYGASATVQPPAYIVNVWQRTA